MSNTKTPWLTRQLRRIYNFCVRQLIQRFSYFTFIRETRHYKQPIRFEMWLKQKIFFNHSSIDTQHGKVYWPVHHTSRVSHPQNIYVGVECFPGYMPGCYIQGRGKIYFGDHTIVSANVGVISANHSLHDARVHEESEVRIGKYCWLGMNTMIMPGVHLGDYTIVAAGAVVTKSFPDGYCVLGGVPAKVIKKLNKDECQHYDISPRYHGYLTEKEFEIYRKKYLSV